MKKYKNIPLSDSTIEMMALELVKKANKEPTSHNSLSKREIQRLESQAELALMRVVIPVDGTKQIEYVVSYILKVVTGKENKVRTAEICKNATEKYNREHIPVTHLSVKKTPFGILIAFIRDNEITDKNGNIDLTKAENGYIDALCWVENINYPDCSELGYCFFQKHGKSLMYAS